MFYGEGQTESYEEYCKTYLGKHPASPAALRKRIAKHLDVLFLQNDFSSCELIMNLLAELAQDNDHAAEKAFLIRKLEGKTQEEIHSVFIFVNSFFSARPRRSKRSNETKEE